MLSNLVSNVYRNRIHPVVTNSFWIVLPFTRILYVLQYVYTGPKSVYRNWISPAFTYIFHRLKNVRSKEKTTETEPTDQNTKSNNENDVQKKDSKKKDNINGNTTLHKTTQSSEEKTTETEPTDQNTKSNNENDVQKKDSKEKDNINGNTTLHKTTQSSEEKATETEPTDQNTKSNNENDVQKKDSKEKDNINGNTTLHKTTQSSEEKATETEPTDQNTKSNNENDVQKKDSKEKDNINGNTTLHKTTQSSEEKATETEPTDQNTKSNNENDVQKKDSKEKDNINGNTTLHKTTQSSEEKAKEIEPPEKNDNCTNENEIQKKDNTKKKKKKNTRLEKNTKLDNDSILQKKPKGFPNLGNTCYMNAILQNLVWTPSIDQSLSKNKHDKAETALLNLVKESQNGCGDKVNQNILSAVLNAARKHNSQFCGYRQQDSFEMYNTLVGGIQDEKLSCEPEMENSQDLEHIMKICPLTRLFGGVFMTVFQYQSCGHVELNFQMFTSICVPVPKEETHFESKPQVQTEEVKEEILVDLNTKGIEVKNELKMSSDKIVEDDTISDKSNQTDVADFTFSPRREVSKVPMKLLQEANTGKPLTGIELGLTELTDIEEFGEDIFSCTECTSKEPEYYAFDKTLKKLFVITPPPVLVLQINRFMQERRGLRKINKRMSFPEILIFSTYCSAAYKAYEVTDQCSEKKNTCILYDLYGVVAHSGTLSGGHYVAYLKTSRRHPETLSEQFLKNGGFTNPESIQDTILEFFKKENKAENVHNQADRESVPSTGNQPEDLHNEDKSAWYYISDSCVSKTNKQDVLAISNAYILFYERIE